MVWIWLAFLSERIQVNNSIRLDKDYNLQINSKIEKVLSLKFQLKSSLSLVDLVAVDTKEEAALENKDVVGLAVDLINCFSLF